MSHLHSIIYSGNKIDDGHNGFFNWIECFCGLTGINDNEKTVWNEYNFSKRIGKTVWKRSETN